MKYVIRLLFLTARSVAATLCALCALSFSGLASAADDIYFIPQSSPAVDLDVLGNDGGFFANDTWNIITPPTNGTATQIVTPFPGVLRYTPNPGFVGTETIVYANCPFGAACQNFSVTINVVGPAVAVDDSVTTEINTPVLVPVQNNDLIAPTPPAFGVLSIVTGPTNGSVTVPFFSLGAGTAYPGINYTPNTGFFGTDTVQYRVCRQSQFFPNTDCSVATLTIIVRGPPVAVDDVETIFVGDFIVIDKLANDSNYTPLASLSLLSTPTLGTVSFTGNLLNYTAGTQPGLELLDYEVCRTVAAGPPLCSIATIAITILPGPIVVDDTLLVTMNRSGAVDVTLNDVGVVASTVAIAVPPTNGVAVANPSGTIAYTPNRDFVGDDELQYVACAVAGPRQACATARVRISVGRPVSDLAVSKSTSNPPRVGQSATFVVSVSNNGPEPSVGTVTLTDELPRSIENVAVQSSDPNWSCTSAASRVSCRYTGSIAVGSGTSVQIIGRVVSEPTTRADGLCEDSNRASISLEDFPQNSRDNNIANDVTSVAFSILPAVPVATSDTAATLMNRAVSLNPIRNDKANVCGGALDERSVAFVPNSQRGEGTFGVAADGSIAFQPAPGFRGIASIRYTVVDRAGQRSNEATISVNVLPPNYYVSNFSGQSVSVVDLDSLGAAGGARVTTVPVAAGPDGILVTAGGDAVFVASYSGAVVTQIDGLTLQSVRQLPVTGGPLALAYPGDGTLLVAQYDAGTLSQVPLASGTARSLTLGHQPAGMAHDAVRNALYVALRGDGRVAKVDLANWRVATSVAVGKMPGGVALNPTRNELYVANGADNSLSVIDTTTDALAATIPLGGISPGAIAISRDGRRAYVSMFYSNTVAIVDTGARAVIGSIAVGKNPTGVSLDFTGTKLLVSEFGSNTLSVIELASTERRTSINVGSGPASFGQFVAQP